MINNNSLDRAIARKQVQESFSTYSFPRIDPLLEADLRHGWMFRQVIRWDRVIYGRWEYWIDRAYDNIKKNKLSDYWNEVNPSIPKIDFLEPDFTYPGSQMIKCCLSNIKHPRISDRSYDVNHFNYLIDWILFGLGDNKQRELPQEPDGCDGASDRLFQVFSVPHFMQYPCDYFCPYLEQMEYLPKVLVKSHEFIRECLIGEILKSSKEEDSNIYMDDPEILTGRVLLELSNYVIILSGWSRDPLLGKCALINGYFFAPWICKHLCWDLASIYNPDAQEEISTCLTETEIQRLSRLSKNTDLVGCLTDTDFYQVMISGGYRRDKAV